jgi:hypothetical protein
MVALGLLRAPNGWRFMRKHLTAFCIAPLIFLGCGAKAESTVIPVESITLNATADANEPAVRLNQPQLSPLGLPFAPVGFSGCAEMNFYRIQFGLPERFGDGGGHQRWVPSDGLGWRESKCQNDVTSSTGCCHGYWQLYISLFLRDTKLRPKVLACNVTKPTDVLGVDPYSKQRNACVAKALYDLKGLDPWKPY